MHTKVQAIASRCLFTLWQAIAALLPPPFATLLVACQGGHQLSATGSLCAPRNVALLWHRREEHDLSHVFLSLAAWPQRS